MTERRPIAAGNWKMNLRRPEAASLAAGLRAEVGADDPETIVFPPHLFVPAVADVLIGSHVAWGGQDLHPAELGAHTGDVAGWHLVDHACDWVLVGHSERRHDHGEDDATVAAKIEAASRVGLTPILCVGETSDERAAGRTLEVLSRQLAAAAPALPTGGVVAYEPVWAIGTGDTATPGQAQEAHAFLRGQLEERLGADVAAATRILYGGSVKPANAAELAAEPDIDGFLVGGASLDVASFSSIIRALR